jgi:hypothetical protein
MVLVSLAKGHGKLETIFQIYPPLFVSFYLLFITIRPLSLTFKISESCQQLYDLETTKNKQTKQQGEDRRSFPKPKNFFGRPFPSATKKGRVTKRENEKPCFFRIVSFLKHLFTGSHGYQTLGDPTRPSGKSDIIITRVFPGRHRFRLRGHLRQWNRQH